MRTQQLVSYIKRSAPDWSRIDILEFIDTIQTAIIGTRTEAMRLLDTTLGGDPVLNTEDGVLVYELDSVVPMWDSGDPQVPAPVFGYDVQYIESVTERRPYGPGIYYNNIPESNEIRVMTYKATERSLARIVFTSDPLGMEYPVGCYEKPAKLLSENDQLVIPPELHIPHVFTGVKGLMELSEHGTSNAYEQFNQQYLPEARSIINDEGQTLVQYTNRTDY